MSISSRSANTLVFLIVLVALLVSPQEPLASGYLDPAGKVEAQDEAVYSHAALRMAQRGEWLTPRFLGRYFLYKPPMVYWLSGAAAKISTRWLRVPAALAATGTCVILFAWAGGGLAGMVAVLVALSSGLFWELARRNMTDMPLCFFVTFGLWAFDRRRWLWAPAMAVAAAILTKSTAGLIPLIVMGMLDWRRAIRIGLAAGALAAPWFVYQLMAHTRWFWAEFVEIELLAWGIGAPPQTSEESALVFYGLRMWRMAPWLSLAALVALGMAWRHRREITVPLVWTGVTVVAILAFQYHNATYLLGLVPPLALLVVRLLPGWGALALAPALALTQWPGQAPSAAVIDLVQHRRAELVVVSAGEQFHATLLGPPPVRYAFPGDGQPPKGFALDFRRMGIVVTVDEFLELDRHRPRFRQELRTWGLHDEEAVASVIAFGKPEDLRRLIAARPGLDFIVPRQYQPHLADLGRPIRAGPAGDLLLPAVL